MQDKVIDFVKNLGDFDMNTENKLMIFRAPATEGKIFLIIHENSEPLSLEVGVDERLAGLLAEKYETVMPSKNISPKEWVEIICSGQLTELEVLDLVRMSFDRASV